MSDGLQVYWAADLVGSLRADPSGLLEFAYDGTWLASPRATAISISLPLREAPYAGGAGHAFFGNLLPEGTARQSVCNRLGISADNDLALLRAIGGECAGALAVVEPGKLANDPERWAYEEIHDRRLRELARGEGIVPLLAGGPTTRLSLAGAQNKLPVAALDGKLYLPLDGAPSTHILKLPSQTFGHLTANEAFVLGLAACVGLDAAAHQLVAATDPPCLLVERYDRRRTDDPWPVERLHQEDLCQALGLPFTRKYEQEGGPSLAAAIRVVRDHVRRPVVDVRRVLEWQVFNSIAGNSDGHAKNLSIVHDDRGPRLAPFYDLVSTRQYSTLDRLLAMGVGGQRDPDLLHEAQWTALATDLELAPRVVHRLRRDLAERCLDSLPAWTAEFRQRNGDQAILQRLPRAIRQRAKRVMLPAR